MINISKIDPDFEVFKKNPVIIWGESKSILEMIDLFNFFDINIIGICEEKNKNIHNITSTNSPNSTIVKIYKNIPVITQDEIKDLYANNNNLIVQIAMNSIFEILVMAKVQMMGIKNYICTQETLNFLGAYKKVKDINQYPELNNPEKIKKSKSILIENIKNNAVTYINTCQLQDKSPLLLCLPPKTGDNTLESTFNSNNIQSHNYWHTPKAFDINNFNNNNNIKIITAIREPISQNLSLFYSTLTLLNYTNNNYLLRLFENNKFLTSSNRDAQTFFDIWLDETGYLDPEVKKSSFNTIQYFIPEFQKNILDILNYEFDKESGYTIIKESVNINNNNINIEIFVYQLEKMNDILTYMNSWLGNSNINNWLIGNSMDNKWIANSYKQAQKDLKFSKKYFEKCFNEPYLKHFYSSEDIQKFKNKYKDNIL